MTENKISSPSLKQNTVDMANRHRRRHRHMSSHDRLNSDRRAKNILNQFSGASVVGFARIASSDKLDHFDATDLIFCYLSIYLYKYIQYSRVGHPFFSKERSVLVFFSVL